jgi:LysM repeat protein
MRTSKALTALAALIVAVVVMAALAPSASAAPAGSGDGRFHVVASGDTVASIARRYGVDADTIRAANGLVGDRLYVGARLRLTNPNPQLKMSRISAVDPASARSSTSTYTVRDGDVLERIARRHGVSLSSLLAANGMRSDSLIMAGDRLTIPGAGSSSGSSGGATSSGSSSASGASYTVRDGDVLERIARRHGVSLSSLLAANGLRSDSLIMAGDRLTIPGAGSSAGSSGSAAASSGSAGAASRPDIVCPVRGASFMNDWGFPRGGSRFHEGTDLFASTGTTIVAPASGTIRYGSNTLGGTTFTLTTSDGWVFYGAHLHAAIGSSRTVQAGSPVATVGASGNAAGGDPHLHLGVRPAGGAPINPYPALAAACR